VRLTTGILVLPMRNPFRKGGGLVEAPDVRMVGTKGESPHCLSASALPQLPPPTPLRRRTALLKRSMSSVLPIDTRTCPGQAGSQATL